MNPQKELEAVRTATSNSERTREPWSVVKRGNRLEVLPKRLVHTVLLESARTTKVMGGYNDSE